MQQVRVRALSPPPIVAACLDAPRWVRTTHDDWNVLWSSLSRTPLHELRHRAPGQVVMRLFGSDTLTQKRQLAETLMAARTRALQRGRPDRYTFSPLTFTMPTDLPLLQAEAAHRPEALWIGKPAGLSCGRGVGLVTELTAIPPEPGWIVQEYLQQPHLIHGCKYTLRCYVVITSLDPLLVYLFPDGLTKLASRPFSTAPADLADRFVHLTNPDVLHLDPSGTATQLNMSHAEYRVWLREQGVDDAALFARIRRVIVDSVIAAREPMLERHAQAGLTPEGCLELLGLDIFIDAQLQPHLIECNLCPSLLVEGAPTSAYSHAERAIKEQVAEGVLSLAAGMVHRPGHGGRAEVAVQQAADELAACGRFERIYPADTEAAHLDAFPFVRSLDLALAQAVVPTLQHTDRPLVVAAGVSVHELDDRIVLSTSTQAGLHVLNPTASFVWMAVEDELPVAAIVEELRATFPGADAPFEHDVRGAIAGWVQAGLLTDADAAPGPDAAVADVAADDAVYEAAPARGCFRLRGYGFRVLLPRTPAGRAVARTLLPTFAGYTVDADGMADGTLRITTGPFGHEVRLNDDALVRPGSAELAATVHRLALVDARRRNGWVAACDATLVYKGARSWLLVGDATTVDEAAEALALRGADVRSREVGWRAGAPLTLVTADEVPVDGPLTLVVLARSHDAAGGSDSSATTTPIDAGAALADLVRHGLHLLGPVEPIAVEHLLTWVQSAACARLAAPTPDDVATALLS